LDLHVEFLQFRPEIPAQIPDVLLRCEPEKIALGRGGVEITHCPLSLWQAGVPASRVPAPLGRIPLRPPPPTRRVPHPPGRLALPVPRLEGGDRRRRDVVSPAVVINPRPTCSPPDPKS